MFADCHIHMVLDGVNWRASIARHAERPQDGFIRKILEDYKDQGYTYLRDGGDRWGVGKRARELAPQYGITYVTPLSPLCKAGHYGKFIGTAFADLREYTRLVQEHRKDGADFIKIMISGLMDFDRYDVLSEEGLDGCMIRQMIHIAHEEGMSVMAHANGARVIHAAVEAGVDSVEHGAYMDGDALQAMEAQGTVWVPTLSTIGNLRDKGRYNEDAVRRILESAQENVSRYHGLVAPGSDAGAWQVFHAQHSEEALLREAGVDDHRMEQGIAAIRKKFG